MADSAAPTPKVTSTSSSPRDTRLYRARQRAQSYTKERARATVRTAGGGARQQTRRATGGIGKVFVVATAAGLLIMVVKRPELITVPLGFIIGVFRAFTSLAGKFTGST